MKLLLLTLAAVLTLASCQSPSPKSNFPHDLDLRHVDTNDVLVALAEERGEEYVRALLNYVAHKRATVMLEKAAGKSDEQLVEVLPGHNLITQESQQLAHWWGSPSPPPAGGSGGHSWWHKVTAHPIFQHVADGSTSWAIDKIVSTFVEPHLGDIAERLHGKFDCDWLYGQVAGLIEANVDKNAALKMFWQTAHGTFQSMFNDRVCHPIMAKICDHPADIEEKIKTAGGESSLNAYKEMNEAICGSADDDEGDEGDDEDGDSLIEDNWSEQHTVTDK